LPHGERVQHRAGVVTGILRPSRQAGRRDRGAVRRWQAVGILVSNGDLGGGVHLCLMDMTAFGASHGPVLEAGAGRRNALDHRATLASRAAG
jgi:hypothetical protein